MDQGSYYHYKSPYGTITIATNGTAITDVVLGKTSLGKQLKPHALTNQASTEILEYLAGRRHEFDLPLKPHGSAFQQDIWREVRRIGYGQTLTAADLAHRLHIPSSFRQIGVALNRNPIALFIPTHRITLASGHARATEHKTIDEALLRMERAHV